jgi:hypothetical protein
MAPRPGFEGTGNFDALIKVQERFRFDYHYLSQA